MSDKTHSRPWYEALKEKSQQEAESLLRRVGDKNRPRPRTQLPFSNKELNAFVETYFHAPSGMHSWMVVCLSCGDHALVNPLYRTGACSKCFSQRLISGDTLMDRIHKAKK